MPDTRHHARGPERLEETPSVGNVARQRLLDQRVDARGGQFDPHGAVVVRRYRYDAHLHAEVDELRHRRDNRRGVSSADGAGPIGDADEIHAVQGTEHPDVVAPHRAQADDPRP